MELKIRFTRLIFIIPAKKLIVFLLNGQGI